LILAFTPEELQKNIYNMRPLKSLFILACSVILFLPKGNSQDNLSYGIKAGLDFSTILGAKEMDSQGNDLEDGGFYTGFHAGVSFNIDIIEDKFGVSPAFLYAQKGGKYRYEGLGSIMLPDEDGVFQLIEGNRKDALTIVNSYISIPIMFYYKPIERIKISLGMDFGFLVNSTGSGETKLTWTDLAGDEQVAILELDHHYIRDDAGEGKNETMITLAADGGNTIYEYPSAIGAYYFDETKDKNYYNVFDMGLDADVTLFITKGISMGFRVNYGLLDISNDDLDFSQQNRTQLRSDIDRNLSLQVSLGFSF
jgi:hypothetical protein